MSGRNSDHEKEISAGIEDVRQHCPQLRIFDDAVGDSHTALAAVAAVNVPRETALVGVSAEESFKSGTNRCI